MSSQPQKMAQTSQDAVKQQEEAPRPPQPQAWGRGLPIQQQMAARAAQAETQPPPVQAPVVSSDNISVPTTESITKDIAKLSVSGTTKEQKQALSSSAPDSPNEGPKSWADIARPEGADEAVAEVPAVQSVPGNSGKQDPSQDNGSSNVRSDDQQQQRQQGGRRQQGRPGQGSGSNIAPNRGRLNANQMQVQAQQLAAAQQIAVQAVQYGIDPVVYQAQLASMYGFPPDVPLGFGQFGPSPNPQQDDRAYPFLEFFRMYPHLTLVNQTTAIDPRITAEAHYFVLRVPCEQDMHRMLKYSAWTGKDNPSIQQLHGCFVSSVGPNGPNGPPARRVFLLFFVGSVNRVAGLAEMMSPLMPSRHQPGDVEFLLQWVFAKDVPVAEFPREAGLAPSAAPATGEKTQTSSESPVGEPSEETVVALPSAVGQHCIQIVTERPLATSVLMNFKFFDQAEMYGQVVLDSNGGRAGNRGSNQQRGGRGGSRGANNTGNNSGRGARNGGNRSNVRRSEGERRGAGRGGNARMQNRNNGTRNRNDRAGGDRPRRGQGDAPGSEFDRRQVEGIDGRAQLTGAFQFEIQHKVKQEKKKKKKKGGEEDTNGDGGAAESAN